MGRKFACRLFPGEVEFHSLEEPTEEKKYEVEIPSRDYRELRREANKNQIEVWELIEQRFFSVSDLPPKWTVKPVGENE